MAWLKRFIHRMKDPDEIWKKLHEDPFELRDMNLMELCNWIELKKTNSGEYLLGMNELKRRQELETKRIAYIALFISIASLVVSAVKAVLSYLTEK
jgi:hypothetical protein